MSCQFFVVMVKRKDGKVYADLHKTERRFCLSREEADEALHQDTPNPDCFHVVELIASTPEELK